VLRTPTLFLLCLADANRLRAYFNNILNVIVHKDRSTVPVVQKWGHLFFNISTTEAASFFKELELRRLHCRFRHLRTERLHKMLTAAGHDVNASVLEQIQKFCYFCQSHDQALQRFKFTIKDNLHFNYEIIIDVVRIGNRDVLHVINTDTSF
jgi:predicted GTPase